MVAKGQNISTCHCDEIGIIILLISQVCLIQSLLFLNKEEHHNPKQCFINTCIFVTCKLNIHSCFVVEEQEGVM